MNARRLVLPVVVLAHFVCPLFFFTDLTRNPYVTQIALLDGALCLAAAFLALGWLSGDELSLPRTPVDLPLAAWAGVCALSWGLAYFGHASFYRGAMLAEPGRQIVMQFGLVYPLLTFYLAAECAGTMEPDAPPIIGWAAFCILWGALWLLFPQLRGAASQGPTLWEHMWDPYGALLWAAGISAVLFLARAGTVHAVWHAALAAGFLGAVYAVLQYFNFEILWPKTLNPYGGRSVSTFGNPNFMSSYMVILLPLSVVYYLRARARGARIAYGILFLFFEAALLCSLTRSSWVGAAAALAVLALSPEVRRLVRRDPEVTGLVLSAGVLIALFWPQSNIGGYVSSAFGRLSEVGLAFKHTEPGGIPYSPWFQRLLIWACAWQMGAENPLLGKGWGLFELYYPFYQGGLLEQVALLRGMRTHANNAHNEVLEVWAQCGLAGVGVLLWTWVAFFRSTLPRALRVEIAEPAAKGRPAREGGTGIWILGAAAGVAGMLVDNLMNVSLHFAVPGFLFWWMAGSTAGLLAREEGWRRAPALPAAARKALALGAVLLCAWGAWAGVAMWMRETNYFMGFKLARGQRMAQAVETLERAYRWQPREVNTNYELGNAYARSDQPEKALWAYDQSLKANAGYDEIYFNIATLSGNRLGRRDDARRNYLMSWAINPMSQDLYASFSAFLLREPVAERELAIRVLEGAIRFFPDNPHFRNNLGYLYSLGREYGKAEEVYAGLLAREPGFSTAESNLRSSLGQSGRRPPEILRRLDDLRRLDALVRARDLGPATRELARRCADAFPLDVRARFYAGNLELFHGDAAAAEGHFRAVLAREPRSVPAVVNLGQALKKLGRSDEAAERFREALRLEPGNPTAAGELRALGR
ncbi:MAG: tetratricopeptide repeat protein [Elusimicrobiota bacterium]